MIVLGYGREAPLNAGDRLLQGEEEYLTNDLCNNMTKSNNYNDPSVICFADVYNKQVTVCAGDQGGPVIQAQYSQTTLVGVISWFYTQVIPQDCLVTAPQAAANVGDLYPWIEQNMK